MRPQTLFHQYDPLTLLCFASRIVPTHWTLVCTEICFIEVGSANIEEKSMMCFEQIVNLF